MDSPVVLPIQLRVFGHKSHRLCPLLAMKVYHLPLELPQLFGRELHPSSFTVAQSLKKDPLSYPRQFYIDIFDIRAAHQAQAQDRLVGFWRQADLLAHTHLRMQTRGVSSRNGPLELAHVNVTAYSKRLDQLPPPADRISRVSDCSRSTIVRTASCLRSQQGLPTLEKDRFLLLQGEGVPLEEGDRA